MPKITIESSDSRIWHLDRVIFAITQALTQDRQVDISLNSEGPCAEELGLYKLLDYIVESTGTDCRNVRIHTCNQLEQHSKYVIQRRASDKGIDQLKKQFKPEYKKIRPGTRHFGNFVGHGNRIRLAIASHLYQYHPKKTLQSYHTDITNEYFREFLGLEDLLFHRYSQDTVDNALSLLRQSPLKIDPINNYPILFDTGKVYDILDFYDNIFVDIVNQTYFSGNTFFLDDKFWRSVITKTPFIVQGPKNFLHNLKKLGFKTFDQWWDEGYSEDPPDYQVKLILEVVDEIATWERSKLARIYGEMQPVLDHNYQVFLNLTSRDFSRAFEYV